MTNRPGLHSEFYNVRQRTDVGWTYIGTFPNTEDAIKWAKMESKKGGECRVYAVQQGKRAGTVLGEAHDGVWRPQRQVLSE